MKQELQNKLFNNYPKIFRQKDLPMQQTAMCWGITCGDGWYNILDTLCRNIQHHIKNQDESAQRTLVGRPKTIVPIPDIPQLLCEATQVKEKFGGLRFYYDGGDELIRGLTYMAEGLSNCTCEECGSPGTQNDNGWIHTLCDPCRKNIMEIRKKNAKELHQRIAEDHKGTFQRLADDGDCTPQGEEK